MTKKDLKYFLEIAKTLEDREDAAIAMHKAYLEGYREGKETGWVEEWEKQDNDVD